ncbi:MAG: DNA adenine methylase [Alphaproteobacteria bacterium]|nr:DNA adenine methylase [Alphaproteobacteria bacterium]
MYDLFGADIDLTNSFFQEQLITYLGNKRSLLEFINRGIQFVKNKLNKNKIVSMDGFAGSGVVSRLLKMHSGELWTNDLESYSYIVNKCYLTNKQSIDMYHIKNAMDYLNNLTPDELQGGFIARNYAPKDDNNIQPKERVFYTNRNARFLDTAKKYIYTNIKESDQCFLLAPLIVEASIHTNTSGVFKGFHKKDGIGHFGGSGENALSRIKANIKLNEPILIDTDCDVHVYQQDINTLVKQDKVFDIVYYDPPYNQHPYGSNYFMLNILATKHETVNIQNGVSGIVEHWNRSAYNKKLQAIDAMDDLIKSTKSKYILISYNNEGIIPFDIFKNILEKYGKVTLLEQDYNTYRGCRNLNSRNIKVKELLWILEKKD